jgi:NaMN:DMB phosphoribosyltransferase
MSILIPLRLAGLALLLSVVSASAADDAIAKDVVVTDAAPVVVAAQPVTPVAADKPAIATTVKAATDLGTARASTVKRVALPVPRPIHRTVPQYVHLGCSGIWCGRQFVLMLGTAY